jgi:hypothetical protein
MSTERIRRFKWFWAWQDHREEAWLREMANQGWRLSGVGIPLCYEFQKGEPSDDVYRLDFVSSKTDMNEYRQFFEDAGWEHVGTMAGWQYWRKPAGAGGAEEIYTDAESKIEKYRRLLGFLLILTPIYLTWLIIDLPRPVTIAYTAIMVLWALALVRIWMRMRELRRL